MKKHLAALLTFGLTLTSIAPIMATESQKSIPTQYENTAVDILSHDEAKQIAISHIPGATLQTIDLDSEDGCLIYDMKLIKGATSYDLEIDARTGKIYKYEIDGMPQQTASKTGSIASPTLTWQQAKNIALKQVPGATATKLKLDTDDGIMVYDIKLVKNGIEHEFHINAETGEISKYEIDNIAKTVTTTQNNNQTPTTNQTATTITWEQAKKIALEKVPGGKTTKLELDRENGRMVYEIEVVKNGVEYDFEIDATTGKIIKYDEENKNYKATQTNTNQNTNSQKTMLTHDQIKTIALKRVPDAIVKDMELDEEKGTFIYEVELIKGHVEYKLEINAYTGEIYKCEVDD